MFLILRSFTEGLEDTQTFERGLLEDLHGVQLVGVRRGHLAHQEDLQPQDRSGMRELGRLGQLGGKKKNQRGDVALPCRRIPVPAP